MKYREFTRVLEEINNSAKEVSKIAIWGPNQAEILSQVPKVAYPEPVFHWLKATTSQMDIGDLSINYVNNRWEFISISKELNPSNTVNQ